MFDFPPETCDSYMILPQDSVDHKQTRVWSEPEACLPFHLRTQAAFSLGSNVLTA
jgi:hypothetical protein